MIRIADSTSPEPPAGPRPPWPAASRLRPKPAGPARPVPPADPRPRPAPNLPFTPLHTPQAHRVAANATQPASGQPWPWTAMCGRPRHPCKCRGSGGGAEGSSWETHPRAFALAPVSPLSHFSKGDTVDRWSLRITLSPESLGGQNRIGNPLLPLGSPKCGLGGQGAGQHPCVG